MGFYIILIYILIILSVLKLSRIKNRNVLFLATLLLYIIASLRSTSVGNDSLNYYEYFSEISNGTDYSVFRGGIEIGYYYLNRIIGAFTHDFNIYLAIADLIIYYAYYRLIKDFSPNYGLSLLLFVCLGYWGYTVNVIRQELAISFFIFSYILINRRKTVAGIITGALAPLFQRSSLAYYIYFFIPKKINKTFNSIFGAFAVLVFLIMDRIVVLVTKYVPKFGRYLLETSKYKLGRVAPAVVIKCFFFLGVWAIALFVYEKYKEEIESYDRRNEIECQINMVFMSFLLMLIATRFNLLDRCAMFFNIFVIVLIPNLISLIKRDELRYLVQLGFSCVAILYFIIVNIYKPDWNHIYPYRFFFQVAAGLCS